MPEKKPPPGSGPADRLRRRGPAAHRRLEILVELPLLERKRLLEGALEPASSFAHTPYVRPPVGSQARTWFAQGFRELAYKPANSRYHPDGKPGDWAHGSDQVR